MGKPGSFHPFRRKNQPRNRRRRCRRHENMGHGQEGATHYTHVVPPAARYHRRKARFLFELSGSQPVERFRASALRTARAPMPPDFPAAVSVPRLRRARLFRPWDPSSPAFIYGGGRLPKPCAFPPFSLAKRAMRWTTRPRC